jgi:hypothetical protein
VVRRESFVQVNIVSLPNWFAVVLQYNMFILLRHITARSKVQSYQNEQTNYAFSPRPNKSRGASATVVEDEEKVEFDSKYLASAWNDRHASPTRNIKRMGSYQESKMGTFNAAESSKL